MKMLLSYCCLLFAAGLFAATSVFAEPESLLADPGFEHRPSSDDEGWTLFDQSRYSMDHFRSGRQSMFNWGYSRNVPYPPYFIGSASGSYQELPANPGSRWQLTGYGMTPTRLEGSPAFGILQVSFFDADGKDLGTVETRGGNSAKAKTSNEVNGRTPVGEWIALDTGIATAPEGTATVQAFTLYVDYSGSNTSQGVYFDDLALCTVVSDATGCE